MLRAVRARQIRERSVGMDNFEPGKTIELLSKIGNVVGLATMEHAFESGMELHGSRLFPSKMAVRIIRVDDALHWIGEIVGERLGSERFFSLIDYITKYKNIHIMLISFF